MIKEDFVINTIEITLFWFKFLTSIGLLCISYLLNLKFWNRLKITQHERMVKKQSKTKNIEGEVVVDSFMTTKVLLMILIVG